MVIKLKISESTLCIKNSIQSQKKYTYIGTIIKGDYCEIKQLFTNEELEY